MALTRKFRKKIKVLSAGSEKPLTEPLKALVCQYSEATKRFTLRLSNDVEGKTLAAASSLDKGPSEKGGTKIDVAKAVGKKIAEKAVAAGIEELCF